MGWNKLATLTVVFLVIMFFLLPSFTVYYLEKSPTKWLFIAGSFILTAAKIGKYFASGKERIFKLFGFFSRLGIFLVAGVIILKGLTIIKQQEVYIYIGGIIHHEGPAAVGQGIFLIIIAIALAVFGVKYLE